MLTNTTFSWNPTRKARYCAKRPTAGAAPVPNGPHPPREQRRLTQAIRSFGLDLLHCTSNTAPLRSGVPLVITLHDIIYLESLSLTKGTCYQHVGNLYRRWNVPRVVPACEQIITVSAFEQQRIRQHFGAGVGPVAVVGNSASAHFQVLADPAATPPTLAQLQKLVERVSRANAAMQVAGLLLYSDGQYVQVLEEARDTVRALRAKISQDPRHLRVAVVSEGLLPARQFAEWSMDFGFADAREPEKVLATIQEPLPGPDVTVSNPQPQALLHSFGQGLGGA